MKKLILFLSIIIFLGCGGNTNNKDTNAKNISEEKTTVETSTKEGTQHFPVFPLGIKKGHI